LLTYERQHKIICDVCLSFSNGKKLHSRQSKNLKRDLNFLDYKKFQSYPESLFSLLVIYSCFTYNSSCIDTMTFLSEIPSPKENKEFNNFKRILLNPLFFINKDKEKINTIELNESDKLYTNKLYNLYINNEITFLTFYLLTKDKKLSRIQKKEFQKIEVLFEYIPKVKELINSIRKDNNADS